MSTSAGVFIKNEDGTYTGTEICNDGYIEIVRPNRLKSPEGYGAGWMLAKYWYNKDEIKKLAKGNAVRNLGQDYTETEFYDWRQHGLDNLTFDQVKNLGYIYIYIFNGDGWVVINTDSKPFKDKCLMLDCFLDYNDPERFYDHESFWN